MGFETLSLGLTLTLPTANTRNWGPTLKSTTWTRISQHRHTGSGDGNQIPTGGIVDRAVTSAKLAANIGAVRYATPLAPSGITQTVDWNNGRIQNLSLASASGDVTLTLSNGVDGAEYTLLVANISSPKDLIWPASVIWANGQKPLFSSGAATKTKIVLLFDGTNYWGDWDVDYA